MSGTGKIAGPVSVLVEGIPALKSRSRYVWTVRIWDETGTPGDYAKPEWFETGLLDQDEWFEDGAAWIQSPVPTPEDELPMRG